jgi:type II restriction enzyme
MSEFWFSRNQFCPACGCHAIKTYENNRPVADFFCENCGEQFELKSKSGKIGRKIADGAYRTMIDRISGSANPNFIFLSYDRASLSVTDLELVPAHFFSAQIIERRKPLGVSARRAGWEGCNILMESLPASGRIALVKNGRVKKQSDILQAWQRTIFLREQTNVATRGWLLNIMACVEHIDKDIFTLRDVYEAEPQLKINFPANRNVRPKIRQQLQVLRDRGYLRFLGNGVYQRTL